MINQALSNKIALIKSELSEKIEPKKGVDIDKKIDSSVSINISI
jgi:hypothetical protein